MLRLVVAVSLICAAAGAKVLPSAGERIVGGQNATINDHPYQVSLQYSSKHFCGGSLYSPSIVVTAAHCAGGFIAMPNAMRVRVGSTDWSKGGFLKAVSKVVVHPGYDHITMVNDVALVKLLIPVNYSSSIQSIELASQDPEDGAVGLISGWGTLASGATSSPNVLQDAEVNFITQSTCASTAYRYGPNIKSTMICAAASGKDTCQGDSGGPLVSKLDGTLVGVVSWGAGCAKAGYPGVYSDVPSLKGWIESTALTM